MKKQCFIATVFLIHFSFTVVNGQQTITNTVLTALDVPGMEIIRSSPRTWPYAIDKTLNEWKVLENPGIEQTIVTNNVKIYLQYFEFPSVELAQLAIDNHLERSSAVYYKGIWWRSVFKKKIGDASWFGDDFDNALLIRSATTCFFVSISDGAPTTRRRLCEQLARIIDNKIKNGSHVIVSDKNPPPVTAPAPPPTP